MRIGSAVVVVVALLPFPGLVACAVGDAGGSGEGEGEGEADEGEGEGEGAGEGEGEPDDPDVPPTETAALEAWIGTGRYLGWECEEAAHAPREPSPHPSNRICSNPLLSSSAPGALPVGAASVKEIYNDAGDELLLYAVSVKVGAGGATDPGSMYWYEGDTVAAPVVSARGDAGGIAQNVCFDCHSHAPEVAGREQFFTIVQ